MDTRFAIQTEQLCKTDPARGRGTAPAEALKSVGLTVRPGEVFGLLRPNGAGVTVAALADAPQSGWLDR